MNPFDHSEDDAIKKLLEETAEQIEPSSAFTAQLENQLKQTHTPKIGFNMSTIKKITSPIGWAIALVVLAVAFNWIANQIAPKVVPASSVTETASTEPSPTLESTPIPPTLTPAPLITLDATSASPLFRDDFESVLDKDWQWIREDSSKWSLTNKPGWLEMITDFELTRSNLLLRPAPEENFELETRLKFTPAEEMEFAGLLIYENSANFIEFGHELCIAPLCTGDALYFLHMSRGSFSSENFDTKLKDMETVYLRLRFEENTVTAYASENGKEWVLVGVHDYKTKPLFVGLFAGHSFNRSSLTPAQFDYFVINTLP